MRKFLLQVIAMVLVYKLVMPFIGEMVSDAGMNRAKNYIKETEQDFSTKELLHEFLVWAQSGNKAALDSLQKEKPRVRKGH